jgi:hypothetical protein
MSYWRPLACATPHPDRLGLVFEISFPGSHARPGDPPEPPGQAVPSAARPVSRRPLLPEHGDDAGDA